MESYIILTTIKLANLLKSRVRKAKGPSSNSWDMAASCTKDSFFMRTFFHKCAFFMFSNTLKGETQCVNL